MPVHKIPEGKWKELGKHVNNVVSLSPEEQIVASFIYEPDKEIISATKAGMIKRTKASDYEVSRTSKAISSMKLKEQDEVVSVIEATQDILTISQNGYYCKFNKLEVPMVGVRGSGVKAMNLKDDAVVAVLALDGAEYITLFTNQNTNPRSEILYGNKNDAYEIKNSEIPIMDLQSTGSQFTKKEVLYASLKTSLEGKEKEVEEKTEQAEKKEEQVAFKLDDFKL